MLSTDNSPSPNPSGYNQGSEQPNINFLEAFPTSPPGDSFDATNQPVNEIDNISQRLASIVSPWVLTSAHYLPRRVSLQQISQTKRSKESSGSPISPAQPSSIESGSSSIFESAPSAIDGTENVTSPLPVSGSATRIYKCLECGRCFAKNHLRR
jgi:hypothetical protein